jgi:hypothetical protein
MYDYESKLLKIQQMNNTNKDEKTKWFQILNTMPFYVMNYDIQKKRIIYVNDFVKNTLCPTQLDWNKLY